MEQCVAKKRDEWLIGWSDFGLIFSFLGVTTHPCRPKDPRIWKLAKKFNFIHGLRKFLAKSGKCVYNYIHIYIRVEEGEGERVSTLWLQAHSTVRHAQPVEERRCLLYNPWVCQSLSVLSYMYVETCWNSPNRFYWANFANIRLGIQDKIPSQEFY